MTKKPDAPAIRFKGFSDAWEQRKVSELAEKTYGGGTPSTLNEAYWDGDIPWIQSSDVVDGRLFGVVPRKRITQYGLNNSATQLVPKLNSNYYPCRCWKARIYAVFLCYQPRFSIAEQAQCRATFHGICLL